MRPLSRHLFYRPLPLQSLPEDPREALRLLLMHWRVVAAVALAQVIGAALSWAVVKPYGDEFFDLWIGGAVAGALGALVGAAWHVYNPERRVRTHTLLLVALIGLAATLPLFGWLLIPRMLAFP